MLIDTLAIVASALLGTAIQWLYAGTSQSSIFWQGASTSFAFFGALLLGAVTWFRLLGHYTRRRPFWDETRDVVRTLAILALLHATLLFSAKLPFSRLWWFCSWAFAIILIPLLRTAWKRHLLARMRWQRPTMILGCGKNAAEAAEALNSEPLMGFRVVGFIQLAGAQESVDLSVRATGLPVVTLANPLSELSKYPALNLVVALERGQTDPHLPFLNRLQRMIADISIVPALKGLPLYGLESSHFFRHEALFLRLQNNLSRRGPQLLKRIFDVFGSSALLLLLSPAFLYISLRIRRSGGAAIFAHTRIGRNGIPFPCYKFRTMVPDAESRLAHLLATNAAARTEWERDFKLRDDPRVTPIGAFLRRTSLDELPQLWNVLGGDMSLVGPRPVTKDELCRYGEDVDYYLECRPGMTGLWQISGRNDTDYSNRVYLDAWYARNWSLWQDIVILLKTFRVVLARSGAY